MNIQDYITKNSFLKLEQTYKQNFTSNTTLMNSIFKYFPVQCFLKTLNLYSESSQFMHVNSESKETTSQLLIFYSSSKYSRRQSFDNAVHKRVKL